MYSFHAFFFVCERCRDSAFGIVCQYLKSVLLSYSSPLGRPERKRCGTQLPQKWILSRPTFSAKILESLVIVNSPNSSFRCRIYKLVKKESEGHITNFVSTLPLPLIQTLAIKPLSFLWKKFVVLCFKKNIFACWTPSFLSHKRIVSAVFTALCRCMAPGLKKRYNRPCSKNWSQYQKRRVMDGASSRSEVNMAVKYWVAYCWYVRVLSQWWTSWW